MSVFTNPASRSIEQAKAYTAAVLDLLGARNPMEVLQETPLALRKALAGLSEGQMAEPEARGKWSVRHVGVHAERGEESVGHMIGLYAGHDLLHLCQLDRIRRAVSR